MTTTEWAWNSANFLSYLLWLFVIWLSGLYLGFLIGIRKETNKMPSTAICMPLLFLDSFLSLYYGD